MFLIGALATTTATPGSENDTIKTDEFAFLFKRRCDYSNSLELSNVGKISCS